MSKNECPYNINVGPFYSKVCACACSVCVLECMYAFVYFSCAAAAVLAHHTFPQSMQHCLACPICAHPPEVWEGKLDPLQGRESSPQ